MSLTKSTDRKLPYTISFFYMKRNIGKHSILRVKVTAFIVFLRMKENQTVGMGNPENRFSSFKIPNSLLQCISPLSKRKRT